MSSMASTTLCGIVSSAMRVRKKERGAMGRGGGGGRKYEIEWGRSWMRKECVDLFCMRHSPLPLSNSLKGSISFVSLSLCLYFYVSVSVSLSIAIFFHCFAIFSSSLILGHKIKNPSIKLSVSLRSIRSSRRFLLTGTPIQVTCN